MESFGDYSERKLGTRKWVVAPRLTQRLRDKGYEMAISQRRYRHLETEYETEAHGAPLATLREAAPDMLKAMRACLADLEHYAATHGPGPDVRLKAYRAAIAKAEGRT